MAKTRRRSSTPGRRATNADHSDVEILHNLAEAMGTDEWATTTEIAIACGFTENGDKNKTLARKVASRLVAMRVGGLVESTEPDPFAKYDGPGSRDTRWRPTEIGRSIMNANLSRAVVSSLDRMDPGAQVALMREVTRRAWVEGDLPVAFAVRRQFHNVEAQRKIYFRR